MILYAESSAVVSWLLGEPDADGVRRLLGQSELIVASELTLVECDRVLIRAAGTRLLTDAEAAARQARLAGAAGHWNLLKLDDEIVDRARRPFPVEPIRTPDALHLSSALVARTAIPGLALLSLDDRLRENAEQLGFRVAPKG